MRRQWYTQKIQKNSIRQRHIVERLNCLKITVRYHPRGGLNKDSGAVGNSQECYVSK